MPYTKFLTHQSRLLVSFVSFQRNDWSVPCSSRTLRTAIVLGTAKHYDKWWRELTKAVLNIERYKIMTKVSGMECLVWLVCSPSAKNYLYGS